MITKIAGWLYIIGGTVLVFFGLLSGYIAYEEYREPTTSPLLIIVGIYSFFLGSSVRSRKAWAWFLALGMLSFALLGNIYFTVISLSIYSFVPALIDIFFIWGFIKERKEFLRIQDNKED